MAIEIIKFIIYSILIVVISKYILVETIRKLAENLNIKSKTVGKIAGYATSVPELLTVTTSSLKGLFSASMYNILSSNLINLIQYLAAIFINKNTKKLQNKAIKTDLILVLATILIPIAIITFNLELNMTIVPVFLLLYIFFIFLDNNAHKLYLHKKETTPEVNAKIRIKRGSLRKISIYTLILLIVGVLLFIISELLGKTLENLCNLFNISQTIIGILLGIITSIPELITFFEAQKHHKKMENDMAGVIEATNNLLTSNTLNLFIIQAVGIFIINI